jgi:hypothetical protein
VSRVTGVAISVRLRVGPMSATLEEGGARWITWHGVKVLGGLEITVRDQAWTILPPRIHDGGVAASDDGWTQMGTLEVRRGRLDIEKGAMGTACLGARPPS